jgi:hypothetical protein
MITLVVEQGNDATAEELAEINSEDGWISNRIDLDAATEYTIAIYATNEYGKSALATTTHITDAAPAHTGEPVIGQYYMSCTVEMQSGPTNFENVFTVTPNGDSTTEFFVSDLGIEDDGKYRWHATYDSTNNTLTLDGSMYGLESYGNILGGNVYGQVNIEGIGVCYYGMFSINSEGSKGNDPIVFGVDPTTKQITSLNVAEIECAVFDGNLKYMGALSVFQGAGTTIVPYSPAATSSVKNIQAVKSVNRTFNHNIAKLNSSAKIQSVELTSTKKMVTINSVKPTLVENFTPVKTNGFQAVKAKIAR